MEPLLPFDLVAFLRARRKLVFDPNVSTPGKLALQSLKSLRIGRVYAEPRKRGDPNLRKDGVYRIPAISLVAKCELYDPDHILSYLPFERAFASFDGDHALVTVFYGATWTDLVANPLSYINASWEKKPAVKCARNVDWGARYEFFPGARE